MPLAAFPMLHRLMQRSTTWVITTASNVVSKASGQH